MKRKLLLIILVALALFFILNIGSTVKAAEEPAYETISGGIECFFAKGTPITIEARGDGQEGAFISWEGGSQLVTNNVRVFGGGHADNSSYESSNITMQGGTIRSIFGGGLHGSTVTNANVTVIGGTITSGITGGGASILANSTCHGTTETQVANTNVVIEGNAKVEAVFGGGEGTSSDVQSANVAINGGSVNYAIAGGSNGNTYDANLIVTGGNITVMQSVNRGTVNAADMKLTGGTVQKLYVGGEEDSNVTGTINKVALNIGENATVTNLYMGTSGGTKIGTSGSDLVDVDVRIHAEANVNIADPGEFADGVIVTYVYVTVNDIKYELEKGEPLTYLSETLEKVKNVEGKDFVKFVRKGTDEAFDENAPINEDVELEAVYKDKKQSDITPPTGVEDKTTGVIITMMVLFIIANIIIYKKFVK